MPENGIRRRPQARQAPIPEHFHYNRSWSTVFFDGSEAEVELWTTQSCSEALARHADLILGTAPAGKGPVVPDELAVEHHGEKWVRQQLRAAQKKLASGS